MWNVPFCDPSTTVLALVPALDATRAVSGPINAR
jgi:hypothetical protein